MRELYERINGILSIVDFESIYHGFHKEPFALYDDKKVYLEDTEMPYDNRFLGNTAIEYGGRHIAIWKVEGGSIIEDENLASGLVHEMFHVYQFEHGEDRFPDDLKMINDLVDIKNFEMKYEENRILAEAYCESDMREKENLLRIFLSLRKKRSEIIGEKIRFEYLMETAEGMADYAGLSALKQIDQMKFKAKMADYIEKLKEVSEGLFDMRHICYYSGSLLLMVLKDLNIDFYHEIGCEKNSVFEIICGKLKGLSVDEITENDAVRHMAEKYIKNRDDMFEKFFAKEPERIEKRCTICGYDPMNMVRKGDEIFCSHFIMIKAYGEKPQIINGPLVLKMVKNSAKEVEAYYR